MEAIKYYVKGAFLGVKETAQVLEQQEELIADLTAKVADLVAEGRSEEESLGTAIASLGDLSALVAEFETVDGAPVPVAAVLANRLDFHAVLLSTGAGAAVMVACTGVGALAGVVHPGAGLALFAVLAVAMWWVRSSYHAYRQDPEAVEVRQLAYGARLRRALVVWAAVCFGALVLNIAGGTDFWFWPIWVAATVWPLNVVIGQKLMAHGDFLAPPCRSTDQP